MDRILKGYLESFAQTFELTKFNEAELFEYFCNYTILSKIHPGRFSLEQASTEQAPGLYGIAIFVNDHMVSSTEEIDDLIRDKNLYARFVFIQAKTSSSFDMGNINNFLLSVEDFFQESPGLPQNDRITSFRTLKDHIVQGEAVEKVEWPPSCDMYYVTTGSWNAPDALNAVVNSSVARLNSTKLFSKVSFHPIDLDRLKRIHRELNNKVFKTI